MIGTSLHHYRITERLGAGGMGEVYRATDTKLGREVAIKILPAHFADDPQRLSRFEREARALAALNHPNVAAIYEVNQAGGVRYLAMEYVAGFSPTGPLPVDESLQIARQIAEGLEAAHEKGLIHRDLKPANIKVTPEGKVKVLDFGLAKSQEPDAASDSSHSPTLSLGATHGMILGTAAYMSPEQARGRPVDKRTDIWSFGCVLFEMLTGRKAFAGDTVSDSVAVILRADPDWNSLPLETPQRVRELLRKCLQKDAQRRLRDIGDARIEIDSALEELAHPGAATPSLLGSAPTATARLAWLVGIATLLILAAAAGAWWLRGKLQPQQPARTVQLQRLTDMAGMEMFPAISPDGKTVAFVASDGAYSQIWIRLLSGGAPLQLTRDPSNHIMPRWSPDSTTLIYYSPVVGEPQGTIWEISALGGAPRRIVSSLGGCDISHDGKRIACFRLAKSNVELVVVDRDGSNEKVIAPVPLQNANAIPRWSPDDRWVGYQSGFIFGNDIYIVSSAGGEPRRLTSDSAQMGGFTWLPDSSGIIYATSRDSTILYLSPLNLWQQKLSGAHPEQVTFGTTGYLFPDMNAAGQFAAIQVRFQFNIWKFPVDGSPVENVNRAVAITQQTAHVQTPSVSPGDREIVYLSDVGGHSNLWVMNLQTKESRQITNEQDPAIAVGVPVWSPEGKYITHFRRRAGQYQGEQWMVRPDGSGLRQVDVRGGWGAFSPDSRWLYYANPNPKTGNNELFKTRPDGGQPVLVRSDDAQSPALAADGTLYFVKALCAINGQMDLEIRAAKPDNAASRVLARLPGWRIGAWQLLQPVLSPDGKWLAVMLTDGLTSNLWGVSTANGSLRRFTDFGTKPILIARRVSWSHDGKFIYASRGEADGDVVLLEGLWK